MGLEALLTLDLENGVSSERRQKVYDYLKQEQWMKLAGLTTAWRCSFEDNIDRDTALRICKKDINSAIRSAGVHSYNAAVQVGDGNVEKF